MTARGRPPPSELLWIEPEARALVAFPAGSRPGTRFQRTGADGQSLRFEAPAHDSPKWIRYQRTGDSLRAAIIHPSEPTARWTFARPAQLPLRVCRRGTELEVTQDGCGWGRSGSAAWSTRLMPCGWR